ADLFYSSGKVLGSFLVILFAPGHVAVDDLHLGAFLEEYSKACVSFGLPAAALCDSSFEFRYGASFLAGVLKQPAFDGSGFGINRTLFYRRVDRPKSFLNAALFSECACEADIS